MNRPDYYYTSKILSWLFFLAAMVCLVLFFVQGMSNFLWLIASLILFILAYFISPHPKEKLDVATELMWDEWCIELVFHIIVFPIRLLIKGFHHIFDI